MDAVLEKEEDIHAELNVLQHFTQHRNIVDFYGSYFKQQDSADDQLWIAMEVGWSSISAVSDRFRLFSTAWEAL